MSGKKFDVEYYIDFSSNRITSACQWESQKMALSFDLVKRESIKMARRRADEYDDSDGTMGFNRWFADIVHTVCNHIKINPENYEDTLQEYEAANGNELPTVPPDRILREGQQPNEPPSRNNVDLKLCSVCKKDKPRSEFYNNVNQKDGKARECKECHNDLYREPKKGTIKKLTTHEKRITRLRAMWINNVSKILKMSEEEAKKRYDNIQPFKGL